jgi:O-antigen/teichoic acid export membrane protein
VIPATINKLEFYTELLLVSAVLVFIISMITTNAKYSETKFSLKYYDLKVVKEMMSFMSWNVFGSLAVMGRNQGVAVMLNIFFGVLINAAYGIAMQINSAMGLLTQGIIGAISPKILKSAGSKDTEVMMVRMFQMTKLSFLFASFFAIIFLNQAPFILKLWLRNVPDYAVIFCQMIILFSLSTSLSGGLQTVFNALGKIKVYSLYVSSILILNLPIAYVLFQLGYESYTIFLVAIFLELIAMGFRLWLLKKHITFSVIAYLKMLFLNCLLPVLFLGITSHYLYLITVNDLLLFVITIVFMVLFFPIIVYNFSLDANEKEQFSALLKKIKIKS